MITYRKDLIYRRFLSPCVHLFEMQAVLSWSALPWASLVLWHVCRLTGLRLELLKMIWHLAVFNRNSCSPGKLVRWCPRCFQSPLKWRCRLQTLLSTLQDQNPNKPPPTHWDGDTQPLCQASTCWPAVCWTSQLIIFPPAYVLNAWEILLYICWDQFIKILIWNCNYLLVEAAVALIRSPLQETRQLSGPSQLHGGITAHDPQDFGGEML